jgi:hypothetical protein
MRIQLDLDPAILELLTARAVADRRPLAWQAEVLLRRALNAPCPDDDRPGTDLDPEGSAPGQRQPAVRP